MLEREPLGSGSEAAPTEHSASMSVTEERGEISLLGLLIVLAKHKLMIAATALAAAALSIAVALLLPNSYTATARILPPQNQNNSSAALMLAQLGGLAGFSGAAAAIKNPSDTYVAMLKSRSVADKLIERFRLQELYGAKHMVSTRNTLAASTKITAGKDGLVTIEFEDRDPGRAADVANAYIEELDRLTQTLAVTEAARRRLFFERQLQRAKKDLVQAEAVARNALQSGGVAMVDEQSKSIIQSIATLRARITAKEVQISAMQAFASEHNPEILMARQELAALRQQLSRLEGGTSSGNATTRDPAHGLKNVALLRELKYNEVLFELLAKQYEIAKVDEARDGVIVQVLDSAIAPDFKSKPNRALIVIWGTVIGLALATLAAFILEARERARGDPVQSARLAALRRHVALRRRA